ALHVDHRQPHALAAGRTGDLDRRALFDAHVAVGIDRHLPPGEWQRTLRRLWRQRAHRADLSLVRLALLLHIALNAVPEAGVGFLALGELGNGALERSLQPFSAAGWQHDGDA